MGVNKKQFLDLEGVKYYDVSLKEWVKRKLDNSDFIKFEFTPDTKSVSPQSNCLYYVEDLKGLYVYDNFQWYLVGGSTDDRQIVNWVNAATENSGSIMYKDGSLNVKISEGEKFITIDETGLHTSGIQEYVQDYVKQKILDKLGIPNGIATLDELGLIKETDNRAMVINDFLQDLFKD